MAGHVECVMISDENYWSVYVDGAYYGTTHHEDFTDCVFRSGDRKNLAQIAGVDTDDLRYSVYHTFFYTMSKNDPNYDANDYLNDYQSFSNALAQHNIAADDQQLTLEDLENKY